MPVILIAYSLFVQSHIDFAAVSKYDVHGFDILLKLGLSLFTKENQGEVYSINTSRVLFAHVLPISVSNCNLVSKLNPGAIKYNILGEIAEDLVTNKGQTMRAGEYNSSLITWKAFI